MHRGGVLLAAAFTLAALTGWAAHHAVTAASWADGEPVRLAAVWSCTFGLLAMQTLLYHFERPRRLTDRTRRQLDALHVAVIIPAYNEDDGYLRLGLESLLRQTRLPDSVHLVDDGSTTGDYAAVRAWWEPAARAAGIATTWQRTPNGGKRHAQATAVRAADRADVFVTVDSDSCLAPDAIEQLLAPMARPDVQSVAGVVIATNVNANLLTRITDLWFVTSQLTDRSAQSALGAVLVNSGPLAAYRAAVVRDNLDSYLNEQFMGRHVMFSDDSLLTLYAQLRGKTVQQPSAIVFSAMPERFGHLTRMYLRWMRGSTIRAVWRFRYLHLTRVAFWAHLLRWMQLALASTVIGWLLIADPLMNGRTPPAAMLAVPVLIAWTQGLRYLALVRSDVSAISRTATWLLMPLAAGLAWIVLRPLRWYGMATCARTGWGTRQGGAEVSLDGGSPPDTQVLPARAPDDTVPLVKLRDPDTETTLQVALPVR
ncbi:glycosyltransferase [Streptomyces synnematoformans]|uniref:Hyaluronan synthase n=1 Tax=Streptomyces synnematoformans TaxID=415721 RepID=A0ABP5J0E5_9ACTN